MCRLKLEILMLLRLLGSLLGSAYRPPRIDVYMCSLCCCVLCAAGAWAAVLTVGTSGQAAALFVYVTAHGMRHEALHEVLG